MSGMLYYRASGVDLATPDDNGDLRLTAASERGRHTVTVAALTDITLTAFREENVAAVDTAGTVFCNGYQSWTDSREFYLSEKEKNVTRLPSFLLKSFALDRYGDATFYPYEKGKLHGYDLFYARGKKELFILNGNVKVAWLAVEVERKSGRVSLFSMVNGIALKAGETLTVCDYYCTESIEEGFALYGALYPKKPIEKLFGYTSWYNYYQNVTEGILLRDLAALDDRFDLFQIDDGYETAVGDWLSVDAQKLPRGLAPIVEKVHERGMKAGIWLAPFVAEKKSALFAEHPDWFKKGEDGEPVVCGCNWSGFYALDLENADVLDYIKRCLTHYREMGFDFFKLDFLYAASLPRYDGISRSMAAERAYAVIREALPDKLLLGCGATLFNGAGKFDYMRVGPDVSLVFDDVCYMRVMHRERISTKTTLQNTVYRSLFDGRLFGNDPDVFLLRDDNIKLSKEQRQALITLSALFGSLLMTSDNVGAYDEATRRQLDEALALYRGATVTDFSRQGRHINIHYTHNGTSFTVFYDTEKGVLT